MWETWREGVRPPRFALEVVSDKSPRKDLVEGPAKYRQLKVRELVIFDQTIAEGGHPRSERVPLEVWRRTPKGRFQRVHRGSAPAWSAELQAWLVITFDATGAALLRLARDDKGVELVPTADEAREAAERECVRERARREVAERQREAAERQREALERELATLRAQKK